MAVKFYQSLNVLLQDLRRQGYHPFVTSRREGERVLSAEIALEGGLVIHWDRVSCSLWTEGEQPRAAKLEARLQRRYHGSFLQRVVKQPKAIACAAVAVTILYLSHFYSSRSRPTFPPENRAPSAVADVQVTGNSSHH